MSFCTNCGRELSEEFEFCPECGTCTSRIEQDDTFSCFNNQSVQEQCPSCGELMPEDMFYCLGCGYHFKDIATKGSGEGLNEVVHRVKTMNGTWKNKWVSLLLCIFLGWLGAHKFYEGKLSIGLIYLFTLGLWGIGWIVDIIRLAFKPNPYRIK